MDGRSEQAMQTQVRPFPKKQSNLDLYRHCYTANISNVYANMSDPNQTVSEETARSGSTLLYLYHKQYKIVRLMSPTITADPDQTASEEAVRSGSTLLYFYRKYFKYWD